MDIYACFDISIHTPHEGSDLKNLLIDNGLNIISIHTPHEGSDCNALLENMILCISIHTPHEGSDSMQM